MSEDEDPQVTLKKLREHYFAEASETGERLAAWEAFRLTLAKTVELPPTATPSEIVGRVTALRERETLAGEILSVDHPWGTVVEIVSRRRRFASGFDALALVDRTALELLYRHRARMQTLGLSSRKIVGAMLGRVTKSLLAISGLCAAGYGEDAVAAGRSMVDCVISAAYIVADADPEARAFEYVCYGRQQQRAFIRAASSEVVDAQLPAWATPPQWTEEMEAAAKRWQLLRIHDRATDAGAPEMYRALYKFGSSYSHSDAWALHGYLSSGSDGVLTVDNMPSDALVEVAIDMAFRSTWAMIEITCRAFDFDEPEALEALADNYRQRVEESASKQSPKS